MKHLLFFVLLFSGFIRANKYCNVIVENPFGEVIEVSSIMPNADTGTDTAHTFTIKACVLSSSFICKRDAKVTLSIKNCNPYEFSATGRVIAYRVTRQETHKIDGYLCYY
ncbi:MAG: hypothetical protein EBU90_06360 [Proteobacteria bacterium]|nr:hypothetical protein [Pseudomonadota bacterium]NBP16808.1 hypothetical protein [bacterium]